ncbi:MAG TPA: hypothetical protein VGH27_09210 [Streptosporangiaceae bacterium]
MGVEHLLHPREQLGVYERFVPPRILDAIQLDEPQVIPIPEQLAQLGQGDRAGWVLGRGPHAQARFTQHGPECFEGVLAGSESLEGHHDERGAFRVGLDGPNLAALDALTDVEVTELGSAGGATVTHLVGHLDLDVFTAHADLEPVEHVGHSFHGFGHDTIAEVLLGAEQFDAQFLERHFGITRVDVVAEGSGPGVDDHVVHIMLSRDTGDHLAEHRPLVDGLSRVTRFDVLADID